MPNSAKRATEQPGDFPPQAVREQLALFPPPIAAMPALSDSQSVDRALPKAQRLAALLAGDLDFHESASGYGSHALHAFAAKFPPQLPRLFIRGLTEPGDVVLDPMMGSGTAVVEAVLGGRVGLGVDMDPLALRLSRVKTSPIDLDETRRWGNTVLRRATEMLADKVILESNLRGFFDEQTRAFVDYWFLPGTQGELWALSRAIGEVADEAQRRFLELVFSSIIVTKSGGVSLARDLAHSRPHLDKTKAPKPALEEFARRLTKSIRGLGSLAHLDCPAHVLSADARALPLADEVVDLVVTSPPYANAIDYMRAHKFSLVWFGERIATLSEMRAQYIGAERVRDAVLADMPAHTASIIQRLTALDPQKARVLHKYCGDMSLALHEMHRVLRHDGVAIMVVGTSTMRGLNVETHECLAELGEAAGFRLVGIATRKLDRDRRMMPARFQTRTDSMIEQRMHEEYVIGLLKEPDLAAASRRIAPGNSCSPRRETRRSCAPRAHPVQRRAGLWPELPVTPPPSRVCLPGKIPLHPVPDRCTHQAR